MTAAPRRRFDDMRPSQQAGILSNDIRFRDFAGKRIAPDGGALTATAAAEYIRQTCGVSSRRDIDTNTDALRKFRALRTDFDAATGKIPNQR